MGGVKCNLFGKDFMMKYECYWDYRNYNLMMKCVYMSEDNEISCFVYLVDSIVILLRYEVVIKFKVIFSINMKEVILVLLMKFVNIYGFVVG